MGIRAVLFDFDGVIVDSEPLHQRALLACLAPEGVAISDRDYRETYLAYDDRETIRIALERHGLPSDPGRVDDLAARKARLFDDVIRDVPLLPGARELIVSLARDRPLAIASGSLRREIETILDAAGLRGAFAAIVGADDVAHGKPHPEPFLTAMRRVAPRAPGLRPEDCLVIEDSMPGIAAARAAGMQVAAVTHSYPASRLGGAHHVVASLSELRGDGLDALFGGAR